jgi:hypothetical protein
MCGAWRVSQLDHCIVSLVVGFRGIHAPIPITLHGRNASSAKRSHSIINNLACRLHACCVQAMVMGVLWLFFFFSDTIIVLHIKERKQKLFRTSQGTLRNPCAFTKEPL